MLSTKQKCNSPLSCSWRDFFVCGMNTTGRLSSSFNQPVLGSIWIWNKDLRSYERAYRRNVPLVSSLCKACKPGTSSADTGELRLGENTGNMDVFEEHRQKSNKGGSPTSLKAMKPGCCQASRKQRSRVQNEQINTRTVQMTTVAVKKSCQMLKAVVTNKTSC